MQKGISDNFFQGPVAKRPNDVKECVSVDDAERFRVEVRLFLIHYIYSNIQISKDLAKKIQLIQNPGLGEFKIRDMNDEINKLLRIKMAWEVRIKELGGYDYRYLWGKKFYFLFSKFRSKELDSSGREVASDRGYKYFGAAKDLPGVRELFEKSNELETMRQSRAELIRNVDADYYGYLDDDDGLLIPLEKEEQVKALKKAEEVK